MKSKKSKGKIIINVIFLLVILILLSCLRSIPTDISIQNSGFYPNDTSIYTVPVTWTNDDNKTHRVVSDSGLFDSGNLSPGQSYTYDFGWHETGNYHYHDSVYPSMKGNIEIEMMDIGR